MSCLFSRTLTIVYCKDFLQANAFLDITHVCVMCEPARVFIRVVCVRMCVTVLKKLRWNLNTRVSTLWRCQELEENKCSFKCTKNISFAKNYTWSVSAHIWCNFKAQHDSSAKCKLFSEGKSKNDKEKQVKNKLLWCHSIYAAKCIWWVTWYLKLQQK